MTDVTPAKPQTANIEACIEYTVVRGEPVRASRARAELAALLAKNARLRETLCFFASVIKCGEEWTDVCETHFRAALAEPPG